MRYLITGNTGFKGAWLSLILTQMGHEVVGVALPPEEKSLFEIANISKVISKQYMLDIRNSDQLKRTVRSIEPEIIVHLAAQPLVIDSYLDPKITFETNVMGTFNLLEASKHINSLKTLLIITTDKVYKNLEQNTGYLESDALGAGDPYSTSKAMADLLCQSWGASFGGVPIQIARAGNVIGGGDFSKNRLIPDLVRAIQSKTVALIRYPNSVRPWQHVFDCLAGYLSIIDFSLNYGKNEIWNIGPDPNSFKSVSDVIHEMLKHLSFEFVAENEIEFHEAGLLMLNSNKVKHRIGWDNILNFEKTVGYTAAWYADYLNRKNLLDSSINQINRFFNFTKSKN